jgi:hypothetical protein
MEQALLSKSDEKLEAAVALQIIPQRMRFSADCGP